MSSQQQKRTSIVSSLQDEFVPLTGQTIVKYNAGRGNNLHEVSSPCGSSYLVSMPKLYEQSVWLKRGDCVLVEQIPDGNEVRGEILCLIPLQRVLELIHLGKWPVNSTSSCDSTPSTNDITNTDRRLEKGFSKSSLISFFESETHKSKNGRGRSCSLPPLPSEEDGEGDVESGANECDEEDKKVKENDKPNGGEFGEGFKSRVQFVTSGIVTVTNVTNSLEPGIQSLDFETEESSAEESSASSPLPCIAARHSKDFQRQANTIRIQVNYNKDHSLKDST